MEGDLAQVNEQVREASDANKAEIKELRSQFAVVRASIQATEVEWERVTPGMPFPVQQPIPPQLDLINVDLFQYRWVTEFRNGKPYYVPNPRASSLLGGAGPTQCHLSRPTIVL